MTFRVMGIDPGTRNAGIVVLERQPRGGWYLARNTWIRERKGSKSADERCSLISCELSDPEEIHCICSESQVGASIGAQKTGQWKAGNHGVHEVVGRAKHEAHRRRIPFIEVATSTAVKALTGSGNIKGGVDYDVLRHAILAQVRGVPIGLSEHELMAIALAIAGARVSGSERQVNCG